MKGVLARKIGMSRIIAPDTGEVIPVTVLEVAKAEVLQVKTPEKDGYKAVVLGGFRRNKTFKNPAKNFKFVKELKLDDSEDFKKGDVVGVENLEGVEQVKITGISKGRGFAGVIKRHNFARGPESHGSHHHREPGSVGQCAKPGRIMKGKKMPGRYGGEKVTIRKVKVVHLDKEKNLLALKGGVPGAKGSFVFVREAF